MEKQYAFGKQKGKKIRNLGIVMLENLLLNDCFDTTVRTNA